MFSLQYLHPVAMIYSGSSVSMYKDITNVVLGKQFHGNNG
jgi:hypothetical protein